MKRHWVLRGLKYVLFAALCVTVFSFVVMRLWNWLMPALFGWHLINFWQALVILVLSKIIFGGFRGHPGRHMYWRRRMVERWGMSQSLPPLSLHVRDDESSTITAGPPYSQELAAGQIAGPVRAVVPLSHAIEGVRIRGKERRLT